MLVQPAFLNSLPAWVLDLKRPLQIGFGVAIVTAAITLFMPNSYRSEARILPTEGKGAQGALGNLAAAAAAFGINSPAGESSDANFVDVLESRWLKEQILATRFQFHTRSWYFGRYQSHDSTLEKYLQAKNRDLALARIGTLISISRDLKTRVIKVSVETPSAELSQKITNETLYLLERYTQQKGRTRGSAKAAFADARLLEAKGELAKVEETLRAYLDRNRAFQFSADPVVRLTVARFEAELKLHQQLVTNLAISREQALMEEKNDVPIVNVLDWANLPLEKSRPARAKLVLSWFLFASALTWIWRNRAYLSKLLTPPEPD